MTFLRHVPILRRGKHFRTRREVTHRLPSQHVTLLGLLEDQDKLINTVDFILDTLNKRPEGIGDIVNERVRYPVRRDTDVVLQLLYPTSHVLWVWRRTEMKLKPR